MIRGYMENERKKNIFIIVAAAFCIVIFSRNIYNSIRSYKLRMLCDRYKEQLVATTEANRELTDRIGRVAEITGRITETVYSNITNARDIVETVEILRSQIKELEDCCDSFNQLEYYQYWDNEFHNEGLMD